MTAAQLIVGIDLGTTHTVVAFASALGDAEPEVFPIPQLVTASEAAPRPLLPSVLFAPPSTEAHEVGDPWGDPPWIGGEYARQRGASVAGRVVASAKSWLCHAGVDRLAPILPWTTDDETPRISPCDASARYLTHVRRAWDEAHPDAPLAQQDVVLTVPASFDEAARELTLLAATRSGLVVRLLEEPQAAFYDYRARVGDTALAKLATDMGSPGALVLVCDIGGGTTDLSLLRVAGDEAAAGLTVTRLAVGRHLLLGGDNMDLALAHVCEHRMAESRLEPGRFAELVVACRAAKERLLGDGAPDDVAVSVAASGSRLVGGTLSTRLTRAETEAIVLDGFFPEANRDSAPGQARSGLVGFGLPYERDVAITRHIAAFLARHVGPGEAPRAVLLNGGVFHSQPIAARLVSSVEGWSGSPVTRLAETDPDLAVARGAVAYARAGRGRGARIESGSARGYYVEVAGDASRGRTVMCVVPRGAAEGARAICDGALVELAVGRPARFDVFASDNAWGHRPGDLVPLEADFDALPPAFATFDAASSRESSIRVGLEGELTAIGTLDLACIELMPAEGRASRRFRLAFSLRGAGAIAPAPRESIAPPSRGLEEARVAIDRVFGKNPVETPAREVKDLSRELERVLGERSQWTTPTARALFDAIAAGRGGRRRSIDHERVFWQLAGYCLRPGTGDPLDGPRVARLVQLLPEKLAFVDQARGWQAFWIAWRRVSAGLDEDAQTRLRNLVDPFLAPASAGRKKPKGVKAEAVDAMLELASSLERISAQRRTELGSWLLERTWTERNPRLWSALGRLGARAPAYATAEYVLAPATVERWLDHLLREKWDEVPTAAEAAVRLARMTDDRVRDIGAAVRGVVVQRLTKVGAQPLDIRMVTEFVPLEENDEVAFFGERMPVGLRLATQPTSAPTRA